MMQCLYRFLDVAEPPRKCDCIFVLAGMQERKIFGINLWRTGYAPELILSVGRFEWRRFYELGLPGDGGLKDLVNATPPKERHFFVRVNAVNVGSILVKKARFGTLTEGRSLAAQLRGGSFHSVMIISTPIHMRRVASSFRHAFRGSGIDLVFVAVPENLSSIRKADINARKEVRAAIWLEFIKYICYRILLCFPSLSRRQAESGQRPPRTPES